MSLNFGSDSDRRLDIGLVFRIRHYWEIRKVVNGHKSATHTHSPDGGTGKTCLVGGMHCHSASSFISERELTFTFAICCRPSVCLSVVSLSVCNARAPYSGGSNFRQYFYGIRYLGLISTENFTEIVPGEPLRRGS